MTHWYRGVVMSMDARSGWGVAVYAFCDEGQNVVDALSAALIAKELPTARKIQYYGIITVPSVVSLEFHMSSLHGSTVRDWDEAPRLVGHFVEVHLNSDFKLVMVRVTSR